MTLNTLPRRAWIALAASALLSACAGLGTPSATEAQQAPIVFVHGNGDSAATWQTTLWRWESNGWPRARLHAVNFPFPMARDDDTQPQEGRSSTAEQRAFLAAEVDRVLAATGARQVVLMANSRGGNAIRDCIQNGGCAGKVSHAILGGTPNHGVWANPGFRPNNEFNGAGPFLTALNLPKGPDGKPLPAGAAGDEVTPGLKWMTLRSDNNDKFAQEDGVWIGAKGTPTNVRADGPALKGAENVVLPARDHREVSYHAQAFAQAWRFVTGRAPASTAVQAEERVVLDGLATGIAAGAPTNRPAPGARVTVHAVDAATGARRGAALLDKTVGDDGHWGPLVTDARTALEFVLAVPGLATTHIYRAPFARSSSLVHLRPERLLPTEAEAAGAVVVFSRPRGYFGLPRDSVLLDGSTAPGIPPGVAGVSASRKLIDAADRPVVAEYRSGAIAETIVARGWPARERQVTVIELHE